MIRNRYLKIMIFSRQLGETFSFLPNLPMFSKVIAAWSIFQPSLFLSLSTRTKFGEVGLHLQSSRFISLPINTTNDLSRNCSFHAAGHRAILSPESEVVSVLPSKTTAPGIDALPYILLPLAGPDEFDLEVLICFPSQTQSLSDYNIGSRKASRASSILASI